MDRGGPSLRIELSPQFRIEPALFEKYTVDVFFPGRSLDLDVRIAVALCGPSPRGNFKLPAGACANHVLRLPSLSLRASGRLYSSAPLGRAAAFDLFLLPANLGNALDTRAPGG